ncbi:hypothetical protein BJY16_002942 [Actinoplanes octamycinicus]|uniref:diacylglycerol O-acyltransferase n=1 Tax=Actinoplanes octamycinicus TaxID=135948 RepID=A0A7W7GW79_9ACTN|nr:wax ester/triacylglycerol synthase domain-containing protein [Actinoplanes octamycinicus]MBB4739483.1 hypothetical protein [Actinoplanes octamycinicus]GIE54666.1 hypothetical protein Aoc01nite_00680 [Actinoplanes octamycinicus]
MESRFPRLTAEDLINLAAESPDTPIHVAAVAVVDGAPLTDAAGRLRLDEIRATVGERLDRVPRLRQVIRDAGPFAGRPIWVDAPNFRVADHIDVAELPEPRDDQVAEPPKPHDEQVAEPPEPRDEQVAEPPKPRDEQVAEPPEPHDEGATELLEPRDEESLLRLTERLIRPVLDPARPRWRMWLVPGLPGGRVGVVVVLHHVIADGMATIRLLTTLLGDTPDAPVLRQRRQPAPRWSDLVTDHFLAPARALRQTAARLRLAARPPHQITDHFRASAQALRRSTPQSWTRGRLLLPFTDRSRTPGRPLLPFTDQSRTRVRPVLPSADQSPVHGIAPPQTAAWSRGGSRSPMAGLRMVRAAWRAPRTSLTAPLTPGRRLAVLSLDLDEARTVAHRHHATINDLVLALAAGGVRALLRSRHEPLDRLWLNCSVAVSLRPGRADRPTGNRTGGLPVRLPVATAHPADHPIGNRTGGLPVRFPVATAHPADHPIGNRTGGLLVRLPVATAHPADRLRAVAAGTARAKREQSVTAATALLVAMARTGLIGWFSRRQRGTAMMASDLAGPVTPIRLLGAPVRHVYAVGNLAGNVGLSVVALSYAGELAITVQAGADGFPDLPVLIDGMRRDWTALRAAAGRPRCED